MAPSLWQSFRFLVGAFINVVLDGSWPLLTLLNCWVESIINIFFDHLDSSWPLVALSICQVELSLMLPSRPSWVVKIYYRPTFQACFFLLEPLDAFSYPFLWSLEIILARYGVVPLFSSPLQHCHISMTLTWCILPSCVFWSSSNKYKRGHIFGGLLIASWDFNVKLPF